MILLKEQLFSKSPLLSYNKIAPPGLSPSIENSTFPNQNLLFLKID